MVPQKIEVVCSSCGTKFIMSYSGYNKVKRGKRPFLCPACMTTLRAERMKKRNAERTPEEKARQYSSVSEKKKAFWASKTDAEKAQILTTANAAKDEYIKNRTDEEKERVSKIHTESNIRRLEAMTEEEKKKVAEDAKKRWQSKSDEEKEEHAQRSRDMWSSMSDTQYDSVREKMSQGKKAFWASLTDVEINKISSKISRTLIDRWNSMSEEEQLAHSQKIRMGMSEMDIKDREEMLRKISEGLSRFWASAPDDLKETRAAQLSEGRAKWYESLTEEERKQMSEERSKQTKKHWESLSNEEKEKVSLINKERWENLPEDAKRARAELSSNIFSEWWSTVSEEDKKNRLNRLLSSYLEWWNSLSEDELRKISEKRREYMKNYWEHLSPSERSEAIHKSLRSQSSINNNFNRRFERQFSESTISESYYLVPETIMFVDNITHSWDYGIYDKSTNQLVMLVDLDGEYYHADKCDYDSLHSKEERDQIRGLTIPSGVKNIIIYEDKFAKSFQEMIEELVMNYNEWLDSLFKQYRLMPFPSPSYSNIELIRSYNSLVNMDCTDKYHKNISLNTRIGDRLIQHFHQSIWRAHYKGEVSPYEAWYNDELLKKCIRNRIIYQNHLNPNKILQGFNISKIAPKVSVFSAGRAKIIISKYLSEYTTVFDPFSGFSGRMLGAISLGKRYIGQDISPIHVIESNNMLHFLHYCGIQFQAIVTQADSRYRTIGNYPCLFTCPPYGDKEQWQDVPADKRSCDDWIGICLHNFNCQRYVFVVDSTQRYTEYIVDEIKNTSYFGTNSEYVILINKEG